MTTVPVLATWTFDSDIGSAGESKQYIDMDSNGLIWSTDYGTPDTVGLNIRNSSGVAQFSSPIASGLDTGGTTSVAFSQSGGVAYNPNDGYMYALGSYGAAADLLMRFDISTGAAVAGIRLSDTSSAALTGTGDLDFDDNGNLVICRKTSAQFYVYTAAGVAYPATAANAAYEYGAAGWHLNRGCSISPDFGS